MEVSVQISLERPFSTRRTGQRPFAQASRDPLLVWRRVRGVCLWRFYADAACVDGWLQSLFV